MTIDDEEMEPMAKRKGRKAGDEVAQAERDARLAAGLPDSPPGGAGAPHPAAGDEHPPASDPKNSKNPKTRRVALYLRVSTRGQTVENQERDLRDVAARAGWQIVRVYKDQGISGAKGRDQRPAFDAMLNAVTRREFDMVAAWSVDRLGRSVQHLVTFLQDVQGAGVDLYLHQQAIDTSTPSGRALFQMMGVFAEFERAMIQERIFAGLDRAKAQGTRLGKAPVPPEKIEAIRQELAKGTGVLKVGRMFSVGTPTVMKVRKEMHQ